MSLPGGFSDCKQFWGVQLKQPGVENKVRVNSDTKLHITKVLVDFGYTTHKATCAFSIGVRYEAHCDCDFTKQSCSLHPQQQQGCLMCIIVPEKKEADLDLNFIGGKNLTFYYSCNCACAVNSFNTDYKFSVNISGYEVRVDYCLNKI